MKSTLFFFSHKNYYGPISDHKLYVVARNARRNRFCLFQKTIKHSLSAS